MIKINQLLLRELTVLSLPIVCVVYGFFLGQLHQSMYDLAGVLIFTMGSVGGVLSGGSYYVLRNKFGRFDTALLRLSWGALGCLVVFSAIFAYVLISGK